MPFKWPAKDPNEILDYEHDWGPRIDEGDNIVGQPEAFVTDGDVTVDSTAMLDATNQRIWVSGGTVKPNPDRLTLRVNTQAGRVLDEGIKLPIKER